MTFPDVRAFGIATMFAGALYACSDAKSPPAAAAPEPAPEPATKPAAEPAPSPTPPPTEMASAPTGAKVSFGALTDGATVNGPNKDGKVEVAVKMVAEGITVKPAGAPVEGTGHHHIIIDGKALDKGVVVPMNETNLHFGKGQTETSVQLTPGEHTLTLQFADGLHRSYGPDLSATVKVNVAFE